MIDLLPRRLALLITVAVLGLKVVSGAGRGAGGTENNAIEFAGHGNDPEKLESSLSLVV